MVIVIIDTTPSLRYEIAKGGRLCYSDFGFMTRTFKCGTTSWIASLPATVPGQLQPAAPRPLYDVGIAPGDCSDRDPYPERIATRQNL